ncbi:hypothetical protein HYDPIDRAFT_170560 [Hydnomerulius pinastri MD-312]|uniref:Uncharacterized protein n=1 Tax=Hydnomerulius pinastri MD-312 TaxID=994086 RepID=A0A0C9W9D6_9AGAM|nr:hypothetical protein HYDPIDRAFT_170560 [Hydnomerulius pinastri MD-312]
MSMNDTFLRKAKISFRYLDQPRGIIGLGRKRASIPGSMLSPPIPSTSMHGSRPLRSSPLAGPGFSTLPSIISESSEDSHDEAFGESSNGHARSPSSSVASHALSATGSGYDTGYGSGNGSILAEGEASTSSFSLSVSGNGTASSQGHGNGQSYRPPPARLSKSAGAIPTLGFFRRTSTSGTLGNEASISAQPVPPPRARTRSHEHSRSASLPARSLVPPQESGIPQTYSPASSRPTSPASSSTHRSTKSSHQEGQNGKQSPSTARDPAENWLSSSPFGPAMTPRFSRLAMASPAVVMPLSAKEYRKQKAGGADGKGKEKGRPISTNHVSFADSTGRRASMPLLPRPSVLPPPEILRSETPTPSVSLPSADPSFPQPDPQRTSRSRSPPPPVPVRSEPKTRPPSPPSSNQHPSSPKHARTCLTTRRTPSPPLGAHTLSPKSSANTFFSFASSSSEDEVAFPANGMNSGTSGPAASLADSGEADAIPPARPRPRPRRRRSFPDRRSGGARLSLVDAMNRLSQEGSFNRLSVVSQTSAMNRLSVLSQASGNTLFYDFAEAELENEAGENQRASVLRTQSLEDLSSTLARTGIEVVERDADEDGKRGVRVVRISDNVEVSGPIPAPRRRKLTKSRPPPPPVRESVAPPTRGSTLLPWISRGLGEGKGTHGGRASGEVASPAKEHAGNSPSKPTGPTFANGGPSSLAPISEGHASLMDTAEVVPSSPKDIVSELPAPEADSTPPSAPPKRGRRFSFQFIPAPSFHRMKRDKSKTVPDPSTSLSKLGSEEGKKGKTKGKKGVESGFGTDSTGTGTLTPGSQSTLVPASTPSAVSASSLHTPSMPSIPSLRESASAVPTPKPMILGQGAPNDLAFSHSFSTIGGDSTPSLTTSGSTTASSSLPSFVRLPTDAFVRKPSQLKECFTDTSEDDVDGATGTHICPGHYRDRIELLADAVGSGILNPRPPSRPVSSSSTATTATYTSYVSFSTVPPASTPSSSSTPSVSEQESQSVLRHPFDEMHPCAMCGHPMPVAKATGGEQDSLHPMFTVPLVTITASSASQVNLPLTTVSPARSSASQPTAKTPGRGTSSAVFIPAPAPNQRPSTKNSNRHSTSPLSNKVSSTPAKSAAHPVAVVTPANAFHSPSPSPSPRLRRPRPQTAPAGTGDAALKFAEAMRVRELVAGSAGAGTDTKLDQGVVELKAERVVKSGAGESKLKAVLRGWLGRA